MKAMFTTPRKQKQTAETLVGKDTCGVPASAAMVAETADVVGHSEKHSHSSIVPEIVINSSYSCAIDRQQQQQQQHEPLLSGRAGGEDMPADSEDPGEYENTALLPQNGHQDQPTIQAPISQTSDLGDFTAGDEFEEFLLLHRTISESDNIHESSIYSELQFAPSISGGSSADSGGSTVARTPQPSAAPGVGTITTVTTATADLLNSSCDGSGHLGSASTNSRSASKRSRRRHKSKTSSSTTTAATTKCNASTNTQRSSSVLAGASYPPPQYAAIFIDGAATSGPSPSPGNALGQMTTAGSTGAYLNAGPLAPEASAYLQQQYHQYYQHQRPLMGPTAMNLNAALAGHHHHHHLHHHHRSILETAISLGGADGPLVGSGGPESGVNCSAPPLGGSSTAAALAAASPASATPQILRSSFRKWFSRPSLPFVIGILALGGVACTLGGIVLGSTGLIEHSTQYLSAALLMIGIGVSLLVISGAIWRLSLPDESDECPCYRHMEACRNCNSPFCNNRLMPGSYLYPEFQHRPPPPSYLTSLNECAAMGFLFHPSPPPPPPPQAAFNSMRINTPPPLYRSTTSLAAGAGVGVAAFSPTMNTTTPSAIVGQTNMVPVVTTDAMSVVMENLHAQTQPTLATMAMAKEINYLELD